MGLGGGPSWRDEYEWVRLADLPDTPLPDTPLLAPRTGRQPLADAVKAWLQREGVWTTGTGCRVLLVDLDNLRADPVRWRDRMAMVVALARQADVVALADERLRAGRAAHPGEECIFVGLRIVDLVPFDRAHVASAEQMDFAVEHDGGDRATRAR